MVISSNSSAVTDQDGIAQYLKLADQSVIEHSGTVMISTNDITVFEGSYDYPRFKIYKFPDKETALTWNNSNEFRIAVSKRPHGVVINRMLVPGYQD